LHETGVGDFSKRLRELMMRREITPGRLAGRTASVVSGAGQRQKR
jgi:hypothetical protein